MIRRLLVLAVLVVGAATVAGIAYSAGGQGGTADQAAASGWNCEPNIPIAGNYLHCAPPGKPSVVDLLAGSTTAPTLELRVFNFTTHVFAGTESLIRADLYAGQPCKQDGQDTWGLLDLPVDYYACHHFETGNLPIRP